VSDDPVRVILAFYSSGHADAETAYKTIRASGARRVFLSSRHGATARAGIQAHYSSMRLEGESLIICESPPDRAHAIVKQLQSAGLPAVFVLRGRPFNISTQGTPSDACEARTQGFSKRSILARLRDSQLELDTARRDLLEATRLDHATTSSAEWLLDNAHLIRTGIAETGRHLPRKYPKPPRSFSSVYSLAEQLIAESDHCLNEGNIAECLRRYQAPESGNAHQLTIAEVWLFPLLLRIALFESLARLAFLVSCGQQVREIAYLWANRLAVSLRRGPKAFEQMLARLGTEPFAREPSFVTSLAERLQDEENAMGPVEQWIESRVHVPLTDLLRSEHAKEAAASISTANAFGSLRAISRIEFTKIFEAVSAVEAELRRDPSGVYARSDFPTRDRCRWTIERVAANAGVPELDVARCTNRLASRGTSVKAGCAAYYLMSGGVLELEIALGARVPRRIRFIRAIRRHATSAYLTAMFGLTASFLAIALALAWNSGVHQEIMLAVLGFMALFPLSELSMQIVNAMVTSTLPPDLLPKMDFREGIPEACATLVVVPMMLTNLAVVRQEIDRLEVRYLANREDNLFFSLFPDFSDFTKQEAPSDAALLQAARDGVDRLNTRYSGGRFLLFHRPRVWSESEQRWIGRERKRGKMLGKS
jgi:cyclic beta-1,2-glucan synthetase